MQSTEEISRQKLIEELDNLCKKLDMNYDINCGGCCYIAYLIALVLSNLNIRFKLVIYKSNINNYTALEIRKNIKNNSGFPCREYTAYHYAVSVGNKIINSDNKHSKLKIGCIKYEDIYDIYQFGSWNTRYNIKHNLLIRNKFFKILNKYEKENS
jgi:hypothetical protein